MGNRLEMIFRLLSVLAKVPLRYSQTNGDEASLFLSRTYRLGKNVEIVEQRYKHRHLSVWPGDHTLWQRPWGRENTRGRYL